MNGKTYMHQLDAKNRMRIPAKFREELGENYTITVGPGGCLNVYSENQLKDLKESFKDINPFRNEQLQVARFFLYNSWEAEEDKQGRILIPAHLREYAKISKNVFIYKGPTCIEIWSEEVWNETFKVPDFNVLADAFDMFYKKNG